MKPKRKPVKKKKRYFFSQRKVREISKKLKEYVPKHGGVRRVRGIDAFQLRANRDRKKFNKSLVPKWIGKI